MNAPAPRANKQPEYWYDDEEMRWAIQQWATRIGVKPPRVRFQTMPSQWSTITPSGWLTLDPMLLIMPKDLGEFVIVHELIHLIAPKTRQTLQAVHACLFARLGGTGEGVAGVSYKYRFFRKGR